MELIDQLKYYFDHLDVYLTLQVLLSPSEDSVPIETLLTFNKLKHLSHENFITILSKTASQDPDFELSRDMNYLVIKKESWLNLIQQRQNQFLYVEFLSLSRDQLSFLLKELGKPASFIQMDVKKKYYYCYFDEEIPEFTEMPFKEWLSNDSNLQKEGINNAKCMHMKEYLKRKREYLIYQEQQRVKQSLSDQLLKTKQKLQLNFLKGVFCRFKNVHQETNKGVIQTLFNQYGEVAYLEYERGSQEGYLRFTNPDELSKALTYFKQHKWIQVSPGDAMGEEQSEETTDFKPIDLEPLSIEEETAKWLQAVQDRKVRKSKIISQQIEKRNARKIEKKKSNHKDQKRKRIDNIDLQDWKKHKTEQDFLEEELETEEAFNDFQDEDNSLLEYVSEQEEQQEVEVE